MNKSLRARLRKRAREMGIGPTDALGAIGSYDRVLVTYSDWVPD